MEILHCYIFVGKITFFYKTIKQNQLLIKIKIMNKSPIQAEQSRMSYCEETDIL